MKKRPAVRVIDPEIRAIARIHQALNARGFRHNQWGKVRALVYRAKRHGLHQSLREALA